MPKNNHLDPINGETFEYYRIQQRVKQIEMCINTLKSHGYTIIDLEGTIIEKDIK